MFFKPLLISAPAGVDFIRTKAPSGSSRSEALPLRPRHNPGRDLPVAHRSDPMLSGNAADCSEKHPFKKFEPVLPRIAREIADGKEPAQDGIGGIS
jgi:hypothetical protein